jgi:hypothetical protein
MSYGMWCVPPDVGNKVLVTFVAGDRSRGYWFACIYDSPSHHMVPAIGRNIGGQSNTQIDPSTSGPLASSATSSSLLPVVEYSTGQSTAFTANGIQNTPRYAHPVQSLKYIAQGLDQDPVRGAISSSSLREVPSNVYGISTPGRSATNSPQAPGATNVDANQAVIGRLGGHTFVMDDGDKDGNDQLIRLRTAGGHQILMNDVADKTEKGGQGILYIASASGQQWIEFSSDGSINIFGAAGFNVRSKGALNFHSDSAVNINSGGAVNIYGEMGVKIDSLVSVGISALATVTVASDGMLSLSAVGSASLVSGAFTTVSSIGETNIYGALVGLNDPAPVPVPPKPVIPVIPTRLPDVVYGGTSWQYNPGALQSICTVVPAHEPWLDPDTKLRPAPKAGSGALIGAALSLGAGVASKLF